MSYPANTGLGGGNKIPSGYKYGQFQKFTPQQQALHESLFQHVSPDSYLSKLAAGNPEVFEEMEAPALKQFQGQLGNISSRFSGMGMGGRGSSGFRNTASQAASDFAQQLQSNRQQLRQQALQDLYGMSNQLLSQNPYEQFLIKKQQSQWPEILGQLGGNVAGAISAYATGGNPWQALSGNYGTSKG